MKATGIVRRIDELGRVVIPKEIRRTQRIRQGDALEIFTAADGQVVFKKYSPLVELGDGISLSFFLDRKRKEQVLPKIAKTTMLNRTRMRDIEDTRADYEELDDAISSGLYIKDKLNREGEDFWYMHTLIEVTALDEETLDRRVQQVQNLCASMNMTVRRADWCHEQGFRSMLPVAKLDADLAKKSRRNVLTSGAAAAFPFSS